MLAGPVTTTSTIMASNHPGLCMTTALPTRNTSDYITADTLMCFNEEGRFIRESWFADNKDQTFSF
jgi:hypothetical protein